MNNFELLIPSLYFGGIALALAVVLVLVQAVFLEVEHRWGRWVVPSVLPLMVLGIAAAVLLGGRNLKYAALDLRTIGGQIGEGGGILRVITVTVLALCFAKVLGQGVRNLKARTAARRMEGNEQDGRAFALFFSLLAYFVCTVILPAAFGAKPVFIHNNFYSVFVFIALYMARKEPLGPLLAGVKYSLALMMLGSLVLAVVKRDMAIQPYSVGWVPGLTIRLWGLGSNPNSIGPLALMLVMLELMRPTRNSVLKIIVWMLALTVMALAQSKTVWLATGVASLLVVAYRYGRTPRGGLKLGFVLLLILAAALAALSLLFIDFDRIYSKLALTQAGTDFSTASGRMQIWLAAINVWEDSPMFGYGPLAWGPEHRAVLGMPFAFHAHNQFFQALSASGIFGFLSLIVYFVLLGIASLRAAESSHGMSLALFAFVALRCVSEAPLELSGLTSAELVMHALLFAVVINNPLRVEAKVRSVTEGLYAGRRALPQAANLGT